ncbi:MAG: ArsR/SmtB family transcription factor [Candidatus Bathyarchaeia archaeon]
MRESEADALRRVAATFQILSDETRLKIIKALERSALCVSEIAREINVSQSAVSHQLRILRQMDLVRPKREGRRIFYRIADDHVFRMIKDCSNHVIEKG